MTLIGLDEVGTGAWAGPIAVGAVATPFSEPCFWAEVDDSKKLYEVDRQWIFEQICAAEIPWAVASASPEEVDRLGQAKAKRLCAQRVLSLIHAEHPHHPLWKAKIVIDGDNCWGLNQKNDRANALWWNRVSSQVKADEFVKEVSAASVCAKHLRDTYMRALGPEYDKWGFESSVGYGTPFHKENLERYGPTPIHRRSVRPIKEWYAAHVDKS